MDKIRLNNGTELGIEEGSSKNCIAVVMTDLSQISEYVSAFTEENLKNVEIIDKNGEVVSVLKDKRFKDFEGIPAANTEKYFVCFRLADVYTVEDRIAALEAENATLKASQEIQDEAIVELAEIIAE